MARRGDGIFSAREHVVAPTSRMRAHATRYAWASASLGPSWASWRRSSAPPILKDDEAWIARVRRRYARRARR